VPQTADPIFCFHCAEPLAGSTLVARIHDRDQPVCCAGCLAVAELIAGAGLEDFYKYRNVPSARPQTSVLHEDTWSAYERPEIAAAFTSPRGELQTVSLLIEGLRCAACSWLIDRVVSRLSGVSKIDVNAATGRAYLEWRASDTDLGKILRAIAQLGYCPHPAKDEIVARIRQEERRSALKRLAVAVLGMMQVMMFAVATYSADLSGEIMDPAMLEYFQLISLLVTTPVLLYAGKPFFLNAWNSLHARSIGMDVPVSAALSLAFGASVWNTLTNRGEVYFDSVTMFVFFLTLGRFVEMTVRHRTTEVTDALARQIPPTAHRLRDGVTEDVSTVALACEDLVVVRPGEIVPADGEIVEGQSSVNESLLTGESVPVQRDIGQAVAAGTLNVDAPFVMCVRAIGEQTLLSSIVAMLGRAQAQKPAVAQAADRAAAKFLRYVVCAAGAVCAIWLAIDPSRAFEATLAVLVVACPCAFSIAMPAALAAATGELAKRGVLVTHPDAIEGLSKIDRVVFDKTGTLTRGEVRLQSCTQLADVPAPRCVRIAAALESMSEHPIAKAFARARQPDAADPGAKNVRVVPGLGIEGVIDGKHYRLGTLEFANALHSTNEPNERTSSYAGVTLADDHQLLAQFTFSDALREDSATTVSRLRELGIASEVLSGDAQAVVIDIAQQCGIKTFSARQSPADKLQHVQAAQARGERIAMVGDGINDAPVLAGADVSIAMGRGAALAVAAADIILINEHLHALPEAIGIARRTMYIARQNLVWSAAYNFCALPLAALGYIAPWAAAVGMSISSIAVILNAMRVRSRKAFGGRRSVRNVLITNQFARRSAETASS
jgi:Cu2+-exporting ATPase